MTEVCSNMCVRIDTWVHKGKLAFPTHSARLRLMSLSCVFLDLPPSLSYLQQTHLHPNGLKYHLKKGTCSFDPSDHSWGCEQTHYDDSVSPVDRMSV